MKPCLFVALFLLAACGGEAPSAKPPAPASASKVGPPFASPQACFDAGVKALMEKDVDGLFACLSPRGRETAAGMAQLVMLGVARRYATVREEVMEYVNKNGVPMDDRLKARSDIAGAMVAGDLSQVMELFGREVKDKPAYFRKSLEWSEWSSKSTGKGDDWGKIKLAGLTIDGDKAVGSIVADDPEFRELKLHFRKIDGGWLADMLEVKAPQNGGAGPR